MKHAYGIDKSPNREVPTKRMNQFPYGIEYLGY